MMVKRIPLSLGYEAIVDDADYEELTKYNWIAHKTNKTVYARRTDYLERGRVYMHRQILELKDGEFGDHIDGNGLNNTRNNLRKVTKQQNLINRTKRKNTSSKYKGVHWFKSRSKWYGEIKFNKKRYFLGYFEDEESAAKAYDEKAKELHGEYAKLNFQYFEEVKKMNVLQQFELEELEIPEVKQAFVIKDIDSLNWAFRKLAAFKAKEADIAKLAQAERARIDYWENQQKQSIQKDKEFFETLIQEYHAKQLAADPKVKTLSTPYGSSKARATKAQPSKTDDNALLQHIKANQLAEYIKEEVKWGDFKKTLKIVDVQGNQYVLDANGQIVSGVEIKPASISISVEVE